MSKRYEIAVVGVYDLLQLATTLYDGRVVS